MIPEKTIKQQLTMLRNRIDNYLLILEKANKENDYDNIALYSRKLFQDSNYYVYLTELIEANKPKGE